MSFSESARRHYRDGEILREQKCLQSADHLFGLSSECALKAMMLALGAPVDADGYLADRKKYWKHIDQLWDEFFSFANGRRGDRFIAQLPIANPYADWHVNQRYHDNADFKPAACEEHFKVARKVVTVLERAVERGEIA